MRCKVNTCNETARTTQQGKCWKVFGFCPKHAAQYVPEFYKKKYDPENMPFPKRTRARSPETKKAVPGIHRQEKISGLLQEKKKVRHEEMEKI